MKLSFTLLDGFISGPLGQVQWVLLMSAASGLDKADPALNVQVNGACGQQSQLLLTLQGKKIKTKISQISLLIHKFSLIFQCGNKFTLVWPWVTMYPDEENSLSEAALEHQTMSGLVSLLMISFAFVFEIFIFQVLNLLQTFSDT